MILYGCQKNEFMVWLKFYEWSNNIIVLIPEPLGIREENRRKKNKEEKKASREFSSRFAQNRLVRKPFVFGPLVQYRGNSSNREKCSINNVPQLLPAKHAFP